PSTEAVRPRRGAPPDLRGEWGTASRVGYGRPVEPPPYCPQRSAGQEGAQGREHQSVASESTRTLTALGLSGWGTVSYSTAAPSFNWSPSGLMTSVICT